MGERISAFKNELSKSSGPWPLRGTRRHRRRRRRRRRRRHRRRRRPSARLRFRVHINPVLNVRHDAARSISTPRRRRLLKEVAPS